MTLLRIAAPPLAELATGLSVLVHLDPLGFDPSGAGFHVRATFADEGRVREGVWFYRIRDEVWERSVNSLLSSALDGRSVDVLELASASRAGAVEQIVRYREAMSGGMQVAEATDRIAVIRGTEVLEVDLIASVTGEHPNAPIDRVLASADGRFVALQTLASNLSTAGDIDSNACADIYLIDRERSVITRVTLQNGLEIAADATLEDVRLGSDGVLSVAFTTLDSALSVSDRNELSDVLVWRLPAAASQLPGPVTLQLVSGAAGQAQGGSAALLASTGAIFQSDSASFSASDVNGASDVWISSPGSALLPAWPAALVAAGGMSLVDVDLSGDRLLVGGRSSAFGLGIPAVDQIAIVNLRASTITSLSVSATGQAADDAVLGAVLSPNGARAVFASSATNLVGSADEPGVGLFLYNPDASAVVAGTARFWKSGAPISNVVVRASDPEGGTAPAIADRSNGQGAWQIEGLDFQPYELTAYRAGTASGALNAVTAADVLAALKMSVGRNPNPDPDGFAGQSVAHAASPYQFVAADVDGSGHLTRADASLIAELAASSRVSEQPVWQFIAEGADLGSTNRTEVDWPGSIQVDLNLSDQLRWVGVLSGDVDGSWASALDSLLGSPLNPPV